MEKIVKDRDIYNREERSRRWFTRAEKRYTSLLDTCLERRRFYAY
ncbi:MAG: hypothetical protein QW416_04140 [Candidatus Nitrosocaldaceae archaeon]